MDSNNSSHSNNGDDVVLRRSATPTTPLVAPSPHVQLYSRASPKITPPPPAVTSTLLRTTSPAAHLPPPRKIMGRNLNNTTFATSFPSNLAELQLFRVMQNASLLLYYDTLLEMGGDDVQQLCDAGEEEFLEIMSLVGMASKPLHVRRFQKSLHEWVTNPAKFKVPLSPSDDFELEQRAQPTFEDTARSLYSSSPVSPVNMNKRPYSPMDTMGSCPPSSSSSPGSSSTSLNSSTPVLQDAQIAKLAAAAERLSKELPQFEPKQPNHKKKMCKELELVIKMPDTDPRRMDEIRRYAAIYGRFDCKRRPEKPLTLHEVSVNEAAAQICRFIPALLTRRDDLFTFARQVVKNAGCHFAKTGVGYSSMCNVRSTQQDLPDALVNSNSNSGMHLMRSSRLGSLDDDGQTAKRPRYDSQDEDGEKRGQQEFAKHFENSSRSSLHFSASLLRHSTLPNSGRICSIGSDDDPDGNFAALSNSNSSLGDGDEINEKLGNSHDNAQEDDTNSSSSDAKFSPRVQVIAASGDNIIAVANPALSLSASILTMERLTD